MIYEAADGTRIFYEVKGTGDPILLIAGTGCDHRWWALQVDYLSRSHRVITCDTRGAGQSSIPEDPAAYTSAIMADDLAGLLDHVDAGPAHIVGHSLGGCIAQQMMIRHPDKVRSAQLHATWAYADEWLRRGFIGTLRYFTERQDPDFAFKTVGMWIFSPRYLEERLPKRVADAVGYALIKNPNLDAAHGLLGHLHADAEHDARAELGAIDIPCLVASGNLDAAIPPRYGREVYEALPRARWHLFDGPRAAHAYPMEMEEEFNQLCLDFISKC